MNPRYFLHSLLLLPLLAATSALAQPTPFNDAIGDIDAGISTGGGTLDIVKMEVTDTEEDVIFTLTVNGNISASDWGNFMIGIANQKDAGTQIGNAWGRPINMNAGSGNGMTHWVGSWVNGAGGSQLWTRGATSWTGPTALKAYTFSPGTQSTVTYTVTKASLGVATGDTILFDAYSSGGGGGDGAIDALSNPNVTITGWSGNYTSQAPTISSYTLANSALNTTQNITFSVDMTAQIAIGAFDPAVDIVSADWAEGFTQFVDLADPDSDGIYTGTAAITAASGTPVPYRFTIVPADTELPLDPETVARSFVMPTAPLELPTVFFDNAQGYRNVTFTVDMSVQEAAGLFNPATQTVEVRGSFNNFAGGNTLTAQGNGIYSTTLTIGGAPNQLVEYKFYAAGPSASGYEADPNRTFNLAFNEGGAPTPALVLPTVFFSNQEVVPQNRPVTFSVDMTVLEAAGGFTPGVDSIKVTGSFNNWDSGGTAYQLADPEADGTYTGTFTIVGNADTSIAYKFFNTKAGAPNGGYENDPNRTAVLGAADTPQILPTVYWNNNSGQVRNVTFSVDMSVQAAKGLFNPATGTVQLRGIGSFNEGDAKPLVREGETLVYSGTFEVPGDAGSPFAYKFFSSGLTASGFEIINPADLFQNRTVTLGPSGDPQILALAYFSNELFYVTGTPLGAFSTTEGTASAPQNVTVNGQGLAAGILATAPAGFEVSSDGGVTYGSTATITPVSGSVSAATLSVRIAASAAVGSPAGNVTLTSTGSQSVNIAASGTVSAGGGYSSWAGGFGLDPAVTTGPTAGAPGADPDGDTFTNEQEYAFGTNPTVGSAALLDTESSGGNLTVLWLQRGDVTYSVQGTDSLAATPFAIITVTITDGPTTPEPPAGYTRKQFTVPATGRQFYRVQATVSSN
jgi:hypothetical protein